MSIKNNILKIKNSLPNHITLVAATKKQDIRKIQEAIDTGVKIIGENYVQEANRKYEKIKGKVKLHLIGHLQKNKVKKAVQIFDMIQTIDSKEIADEINTECHKQEKNMPILIEVNIAKEKNKKGCMPREVAELAEHIEKLSNVQLRGVMTMAPYFSNPEKSRPYFKKTRQIFNNLKIHNPKITILSMGMSNSYQIAIQEGATMVRIGTAIFGSRY